MKRLSHFIILAMALPIAAACVQKLEPAEEVLEPQSIRLIFDGSVQTFDGESDTKAASAIAWKTNDRVYIRTTTGSGANTSYAQREADGSWTLNYTGPLRSGMTAHCCFFQKPKATDGYSVSLTYNSIIYEDTAATLDIDISDGGATATLKTHLKPKTGRISFHGGAANIGVSQLAWYASFDLDTFEFTECANAHVSSFGTGESRYFYGFFAGDNDAREMIISNDGLIFKRSFGDQVLRAGASGYIDVPTHTDYTGWTLTNESELDKYTPIVIEDANFKAWLVAQYDKDDDGEISKVEAAKITRIENTTDDVTSLKGIEYFTELRTLIWKGSYTWYNERISNGKLTQVDLSGNTKLKELDLSNNQLTALDLSQNPQMQTLTIYGNKLSTLNLSGGAALTSLDCSNNQLTSLDLSGFPSLTTLSCQSNQITSLNLSQNTQLTYLYVDNNKLSSLDISSLNKLLGLFCGGNQLTELNLSACSELIYLTISGNSDITSINLSNCPHLQHLSIGYTSITSLDLSDFPELYYLSCGGLKLNYLDLSEVPKLQSLYCNNCELTSLDLSNNPSLRDLGCESNYIEYIDLSYNTQLQSLYVNNNDLTQLDLSSAPNLRYLNCGGNDLSSSGLDLSYNPKLQELYCWSCSLSALDVSSNLKLTWLNCNSNNLTTLDVYDNADLTYLEAWNNPSLATITVKTGHTFPNGLNYDSNTTEIVYLD